MTKQIGSTFYYCNLCCLVVEHEPGWANRAVMDIENGRWQLDVPPKPSSPARIGTPLYRFVHDENSKIAAQTLRAGVYLEFQRGLAGLLKVRSKKCVRISDVAHLFTHKLISDKNITGPDIDELIIEIIQSVLRQPPLAFYYF